MEPKLTTQSSYCLKEKQNKSLTALQDHQKVLWAPFTRMYTDLYLANYDRINHQYKNHFIYSQISYEQTLIAKLKDNPKAFHQYIRKKKVGAPSVGPLLQPDGSLVEDSGAMAEIFVSSFSSVFKDSCPNPSPHQTFQGILDYVNISYPAMSKCLSSLDPNSSMGPDNLHPRLLRPCPSVAHPIFKIFLSNITEGILPALWKISDVIPIFKKGSRSVPLNYKPIRLISVCCKALERIVAEQIYAYLEQNAILSRDQFGFRRGKTANDQL